VAPQQEGPLARTADSATVDSEAAVSEAAVSAAGVDASVAGKGHTAAM